MRVRYSLKPDSFYCSNGCYIRQTVTCDKACCLAMG